MEFVDLPPNWPWQLVYKKSKAAIAATASGRYFVGLSRVGMQWFTPGGPTSRWPHHCREATRRRWRVIRD